jgi:hypothetical protein
MDRDAVGDYLSELPVEELVAVLRKVFETRQPMPEEASFCRNRFFLGIAWSELLSDRGEPETWAPWRVEAVAYPDPSEYGESLGPDYGLCQEGTCATCSVAVRSNVKHGLCPVCNSSVYMS